MGSSPFDWFFVSFQIFWVVTEQYLIIVVGTSCITVYSISDIQIEFIPLFVSYHGSKHDSVNARTTITMLTAFPLIHNSGLIILYSFLYTDGIHNCICLRIHSFFVDFIHIKYGNVKDGIVLAYSLCPHFLGNVCANLIVFTF